MTSHSTPASADQADQVGVGEVAVELADVDQVAVGYADADRAAVELTDLALAAGRGDPVALTELVTRTSAVVWRVCAALVDRAGADDLAQDTYLRAVRSLPTYRAESPPLPWLLTIARRVCAEEINRRRRDRLTTTRLAMQRPIPGSDVAGRVELLDALGRLPQHRREALVLTCVVGLSYAEAATVCGCPVGTIRSRVARARADLAGALRPVPRNPLAANPLAANPLPANPVPPNPPRA